MGQAVVKLDQFVPFSEQYDVDRKINFRKAAAETTVTSLACSQLVRKRDLMKSKQSEEKRVVVGLGVTGTSCMRFFERRGIPFSVLDTRMNPPGLASVKKEFPHIGLQFGLGPKQQKILNEATEIYLSPGVAMDSSWLEEAIRCGARVCSDIDLFVSQVKAPVIAISGSNAKSTVTSLVGEMAQHSKLNAAVGGNLGDPVLDLLSDERECYVLEISSFQLERCSSMSPAIACLLNISADHLDRHYSLEEYREVKHLIYRDANTIVFNRDDPLTIPMALENTNSVSFGVGIPNASDFGTSLHNGESFIFKGSEPLLPVSSIPLIGSHNLLNVVAAFAIGDTAGFRRSAMVQAVREFRGLPHRCELIAEYKGVRYFNDSKATNVGATIAAINGLSSIVEGKIVLIAGGQTKEADFTELATVVERQACQLILLGEGAQEIASCVSDRVSVDYADSLAAAVLMSVDLSSKGDVVLLSPACASFDMFESFEHRGRVFASTVQRLTGMKMGEGALIR